MDRLILFRHAKAERAAPSGDDHDRSLTERGREDARLMGQVLADAGVKPDLALVSDAQRTRQTWTEAARAFDGVALRLEGRLYNAGTQALRAAIEEVEDQAGTVVLVGHNPGIHSLAVELLVEGAAAPSTIEKLRSKFPTATAAVFTVDAAGRTAYDGLYLAKDHGGGGEE
ncbi:histidine phosphatase family protein [Caulobacter sp. 17J65-9]|uniref:SixA phosphatase family protein n=1 Tax=Caulobacter sp. 17J65-9 TaxID=2709382 RepID=UPI0013C69F81|nr:histidine phosphatase family protein [Caulobacter sp. 17J65-9]NEX92164.1 histidine phosphatase family protein [Caulobacter sp. 17J65-9]